MTELMTLEEIANYLRITRRTIYRLLKENSIPAIRLGGQWRFEKNTVDDWLRRNSTRIAARILVIDDDESIGSLFSDTLETIGVRVKAAADSSKGLQLVKDNDYDLVFIDLKMPGMDGAELFRQIRLAKPDMPVTIITGYPDSALMESALAQGPLGVIKKPFTSSDILTAVKSYLRFGVHSK